MERIPQIRPIFWLTKLDAFDFNRDDVTRRLCVTPSRSMAPTLSKGKMTCNGSDIREVRKELPGMTFIPTSKSYHNILMHACWNIELPKIESWSLDEPLRQLEQIIYGKESEVSLICKEYNLTADLIVRVFADSNNMPILTIPKESVSFWASMGVSIDFDFYLD